MTKLCCLEAEIAFSILIPNGGISLNLPSTGPPPPPQTNKELRGELSPGLSCYLLIPGGLLHRSQFVTLDRLLLMSPNSLIYKTGVTVLRSQSVSSG